VETNNVFFIKEMNSRKKMKLSIFLHKMYTPASIKCRKFMQPAQHFLLLKSFYQRKCCTGCLDLRHFILGRGYNPAEIENVQQFISEKKILAVHTDSP
jgi:hypothetical protein